MTITENFLHFVWKMQLFNPANFHTSQEKIEVLNTGLHNQDAGPDFFNAKVKIGQTTWAGNVEIHVNASDWKKHGHQTNKAYDSVILHVVLNNDSKVFRTNGEEIPVAVLDIPDKIRHNFQKLQSSSQKIPCGDNLAKVDNFVFQQMLDTLLIERIEKKTKSIDLILSQTTNSWEETFYIFLARAFGTRVNGLPFELTAKSIPLSVLAKHSNNRFQLEALFFGQAGMLKDDFEDEYYLKLQKEYNFLSHKYGLQPIEKSIWKLLRLRPPNFPAIRISQFVHLIVQSQSLFSKVMATNTSKEVRKMFQLTASEYWDTHYVFGKLSPKQTKHFGKMSVNNILINTVIPFLFIYGKHTGQEKFQERALQFLESLPAEENSITRTWAKFKIKAKNASTTQSLLQLKNEYCDKKRCTECKIGSKVIVG